MFVYALGILASPDLNDKFALLGSVPLVLPVSLDDDLGWLEADLHSLMEQLHLLVSSFQLYISEDDSLEGLIETRLLENWLIVIVSILDLVLKMVLDVLFFVIDSLS